jgi:DNA-binding transcriptional regulator GbsR (MarR family)
MINYSMQIIDALKRSGKSMCLHEISAETGIKEKNLSGLLYALAEKGVVVKCNEGQKAPCKYFGSNHFSWCYANKEATEARRSDEVGRMLREEHETEMKKMHKKHINEIVDLKNALSAEQLRNQHLSKAGNSDAWKQKAKILAQMLRVLLDEMEL